MWVKKKIRVYWYELNKTLFTTGKNGVLNSSSFCISFFFRSFFSSSRNWCLLRKLKTWNGTLLNPIIRNWCLWSKRFYHTHTHTHTHTKKHTHAHKKKQQQQKNLGPSVCCVVSKWRQVSFRWIITMDTISYLVLWATKDDTRAS